MTSMHKCAHISLLDLHNGNQLSFETHNTEVLIS